MKTPKRILVKYFGLGSIGCFLAFIALVLVLHILRPQENPLSHTISEYAVGPDGFLMTIAFLVRGLGAIFLVTGLAFGTTHSSRSWLGLILLALFAVCSLLVATFPTDLQGTSITLRIHTLSALIGFSSLVIAALAWAQRFRKDIRWRESALTSFVLGLLMLLSLVGLLASPPNFTGLAERILEVIMIVWLCSIAWRLSTFAFVEPPPSSL